jgi:DNA-binding transcriptional regulator LsrR (DeoR family)
MSDELASLAAILYHERDLSQTEIARRLGLSNIAVSRILQRAKESGVVRTEVRLPFQQDRELEQRIASAHGLAEAFVVVMPGGAREAEARLDALGRAWALRMSLELEEGAVLGLGLGMTLARVIRALIPMQHPGLHVVQIIGGLSFVTDANPFAILQEACHKLGAEGTFLSANAIVESRQMRDLILASEAGKQCRVMWERCTEAVFGLGALDAGSFIYEKMLSPEAAASLRRLGAVGDVLGHCFDASGRFLDSEWEQRLVSIPTDLLLRVPRRALVASGAEKAAAIRAALKSGVATVLATDQPTARLILF